MQEIKVSIIMPAYNTEKYLEKALDSIHYALKIGCEAWLIDDGSTDTTLKKLQEFAAQHEHVYVSTQKNAGPANARNFGLKHATGKYIYFMDSDDYVEVSGIARMLVEIEKTNADVVLSGIYEETATAQTEIRYSSCAFHSHEEYLQQAVALWDTHLPYTMGNKLYSADFIKRNNIQFPEQYSFGEDTRFNMQVFALADRICVISESYYHYIRERTDSAMTKYKSNLFETRKAEYEMFWTYFEQQGLLNEKGIEYLNRRHAERLVGCLVNLFLPGAKISFLAKVKRIKEICTNEYTEKSLTSARFHSGKMKLLLWPLKRHLIVLAFLEGAAIAFVRTNLPGIFIKLKASR